MNFRASAPEEEAVALASEVIPSSATLGLRDLSFSYLGLSDLDTQRATVRMFTDLGLLSHFRVDHATFCRWVLTVRRNYRNETVPYHNWMHAFNVAQMMFAMLKTTGWEEKFSKVRRGINFVWSGHNNGVLFYFRLRSWD